MNRRFQIAVVALFGCLAPALTAVATDADWTPVFRHHTGIENLADESEHARRQRDFELIRSVLKEAGIAFSIQGSGSRYEIQIQTSDLPWWKSKVETLQKANRLLYYQAFKLDRLSDGFVPLPRPHAPTCRRSDFVEAKRSRVIFRRRRCLLHRS